jgi:hypothetical protein
MIQDKKFLNKLSQKLEEKEFNDIVVCVTLGVTMEEYRRHKLKILYGHGLPKVPWPPDIE